MRKWSLRALRLTYVGLVLFLPAAAIANYAVTQGSGTNFGSVVVSAVHYAQQLLCDPTTPGQCAAVSAGGAVSTSSAQSGTWTVQPGNTANTTAWKVDGSAVTQPVSGTVTATVTGVSTAANQSTEIASLSTIATNTGAPIPACTGTPCTTVVGLVTNDVCAQKAKITAPFSTSSGGPVSIVALSGSTVVYVCSITAITDTAIKLSFIDGTGGSCASAQHAMWGSTTAANGMSLAANGGFTAGNGGGTVASTTAASAFCLLQSGTSLVAGNITYVQQ